MTRSSLLRPQESSSLSSLRESSGPKRRSRRTPEKSLITEKRSARTTGKPAPTPPILKNWKLTSATSKTASRDSRANKHSTEPSLSFTATLRHTFSGLWTSARMSLLMELDSPMESTGASTITPPQQSQQYTATMAITTELSYQSKCVNSPEFTLILYANVPA